MGKFAGEKAIDYLNGDFNEPPGDAGEITFSLFSKFVAGTGKENIGQIRQEMQNIMTEKVGIFRKEDSLKDAIETLKEFKERSENISLSNKSLTMNQELIQRWELENLLAVSMICAQGALNRRESRGGHFREDCPERKDAFNYHTLAHMTEFGKVTLGKRPVDMSIYEAEDENYEKFAVIERKY
jgi:succinate dehydrogenase / fumarate reductase flavoprotein subunit